MANSTIQNKKVISLALGAVVDGAYLYAGADRGIASEIQGKGNGETIYYKTTNLGQASIAKVTANSANTLSAQNIVQRQVPVRRGRDVQHPRPRQADYHHWQGRH